MRRLRFRWREDPARRELGDSIDREFGKNILVEFVGTKEGLPLRGSRNVLARSHVEGFSLLMSDHIYKKIELVGSSSNSIEDAVNNAISRADKTIRNMRWFEVAEIRGHLENNKIADWQVTVKVGFTLDS
jgi:flavin-binding protein dodecin